MYGKKIQLRRLQLGLSQAEAASRSGITQATLCRWEVEKSEKHFLKVAGICRTLGVSADWLLFGESQQDVKPNAVSPSCTETNPAKQILLDEIARLNILLEDINYNIAVYAIPELAKASIATLQEGLKALGCEHQQYPKLVEKIDSLKKTDQTYQNKILEKISVEKAISSIRSSIDILDLS